jgi:hypothetical protein
MFPFRGYDVRLNVAKESSAGKRSRYVILLASSSMYRSRADRLYCSRRSMHTVGLPGGAAAHCLTGDVTERPY